MNKTQIANKALNNLGVSFIIFDFDNENSNHAKIIRRLFQGSLDTITEASEWSFANKHAALNYIGEGKAGFAYEYSLPADCLVLQQIGTEDHMVRANIPPHLLPAWEFNNSTSRILCNVDKAWGQYTRRIMEDEDVPNYFGNAVAAQLALDIAPALILDKFAAIKNTLKDALENDIGRAISYDSGRKPDYRPQVSSYELLLQ